MSHATVRFKFALTFSLDGPAPVVLIFSRGLFWPDHIQFNV